MYCVYKHTSPSGKVYIGITVQNPLYRWNKGNGYSNNEHFTNAIRKYGWDNFKHEILFDGLTKEEAEQKEIELIASHKSNRIEFGYNQDSGGKCNAKHSEETRKKISESNKGKKHKPMSVETRRRMSESRTGKHLSEETKKKIGNAHRGKILSEQQIATMRTRMQGSNHPNWGKHLSAETRKKIGKSHEKPILQLTFDNDIVNVFDSAQEAQRILNLSIGAFKNISACAHGKKKSAYGFKWVFAE